MERRRRRAHHHSGLFKRDGIGNRDSVDSWRHDPLGVAAVTLLSEHRGFRAESLSARNTLTARSARDEIVKSDPVADAGTVESRAAPDDDTGNFVSRRQGKLRAAGVAPIMGIRVADSGGPYLHQYFS